MRWLQNYDPLHFWPGSTAIAAIPIVLLLVLLGVWQVRPHRAAALGAWAAVAVAITFFGMPWRLCAAAFGFGVAWGIFKLAWIIVSAVLLYELSVESGGFELLKRSVAALSQDARMIALLLAFSFGAFMEGCAGFGAPVAIAGSFMVGLGFRPFQAATLCLIANTAPVAFGAIGLPIHMLAGVSGLPEPALAATAGRILPITAPIVAFWMIRTMCSWRQTLAVLPAILVCGGSFAVVQFFWSNYLGSNLVDIAAGIVSLFALAAFLRVWQPREVLAVERQSSSEHVYSSAPSESATRAEAGLGTAVAMATRTERLRVGEAVRGWAPFALLSVCVFAWGLPQVKSWMDSATTTVFNVPYLHLAVSRVPPVVAQPTGEAARFDFNWLSATGTSVFVAALLTALLLGINARTFLRVFARTLRRMRFAIVAVSFMLALAYVTRYSGADAVLGLAFTHTGVAYPFFGTFLGWLGVALTGSDTSSNALFGSLQRITAEQLHINPVLMAAANSTGGVMGKMIDAQSIVIATAATDQIGNEGLILRGLLWHSVALAGIVACIVLLYAYVWPSLLP